MQAGAYFSILIFATIAFVFKKRFLAAELLFGGTLAWILAWAIKLAVVRPRPFEVLSQVSLRESNVYGFGFPSAHAAVAAALVAVASFHFKSCYSWLLWVAVLIVAFARIYMGVHLPLDVAGGVALGWFAGLFTQLIFKSTRKSD
ncbi:MAG: hypothetical protein A2172_04570 [Candidatus Woykebacteria bacterium RBG_13_40_15]|uniref:Phosphatidic acid phosphatase type 2/haloperoxidase domain-containing protein n=1 Tax=Candidatus Woykebacteria bacterium RBG_13_40_15 TaxID=1802593 RepID=A0A1G1W780_9BACT|nr:MAG: hypothetical protein A2172_04570 [Candidatus Woykebacteria bacterium RBG_13_40_15]